MTVLAHEFIHLVVNQNQMVPQKLSTVKTGGIAGWLFPELRLWQLK